MSIQSEIDRLAGAKTTLGNYLQQNGVAVPSGATLDEMALQLADVIEKQNKITAAGILKGDGAGGVSAAKPGTDYLTEAPVTSVNGAIGEVKSTFYVTVTQGDDGSVTADKTVAEVYEAYAAGYAVYAIANLNGYDIPTILTMSTVVKDFDQVALGFVALTGPRFVFVQCNGSAWAVITGMLASREDIPTVPEYLPNPNALNIKIGDTTTSYDGSLTQDVEIPEGVPSVTTADNGKFLRVVNGAWVAAEIDNANGGSF